MESLLAGSVPNEKVDRLPGEIDALALVIRANRRVGTREGAPVVHRAISDVLPTRVSPRRTTFTDGHITLNDRISIEKCPPLCKALKI
jgi:hypothetical protein